MKYIALKNVCKINMGQSPNSLSYNDQEDGIPFFQGNADFGERYPVTRVWCNAPTKIAQPEDILISVRAPIGALNFAKEKCCIGRGLAGITPDRNKVSPEFIYWALKGKTVELNRKGTGSTFKAISRKVLEETMVPAIDFEQQQEYADTLEKVYSIIQKWKVELTLMDDLIKARFVEMFGDVQSEEKYKGIHLRDLCTTMSGGTPSTRFPEYYEGNIPWISTVSLGDNYINGSNAKAYITQDAIDNSATKLIPAGNILFGTRVGVGKSSLNDVDICINQDIIAIIGIDESRFNRLFIKHVLDAYQSYYDGIKKGATILGITGDDLKDTLIPNVPIALQNQFADFVRAVDKSKFYYSKAVSNLIFSTLRNVEIA